MRAVRPLPAIAVTALLVTGTLLVANRPDPWSGWRPATCMPDACFCEAIRDQLVRQPANTLSSLAFVPLALLAFGVARRQQGAGANLLQVHAVLPRLYGAALALIGLGSAFYHASLTFAGQTADVLGMYLIASFMAVYAAARLYDLSARTTAVIYLAGNAALLLLLVEAPELRRYLFGLVVVAALALELRARRRAAVRPDGRWLGAGLVALAVGFAIWTVDITGIACAPTSLLQGHAAWHVLTAASAGLLFLYYDSERLAA
jgi:hypothetical protein